MNKKINVITINGFRGILTAIFIVTGLIAGFIISPGWVCMKLWNMAIEHSHNVMFMNLFQGIILWLIIALSLYALNNRRLLIGFGSYNGLSKDQISNIMERAKKAEAMMLKEFEAKQVQPEEKEEAGK